MFEIIYLHGSITIVAERAILIRIPINTTVIPEAPSVPYPLSQPCYLYANFPSHPIKTKSVAAMMDPSYSPALRAHESASPQDGDASDGVATQTTDAAWRKETIDDIINNLGNWVVPYEDPRTKASVSYDGGPQECCKQNKSDSRREQLQNGTEQTTAGQAQQWSQPSRSQSTHHQPCHDEAQSGTSRASHSGPTGVMKSSDYLNRLQQSGHLLPFAQLFISVVHRPQSMNSYSTEAPVRHPASPTDKEVALPSQQPGYNASSISYSGTHEFDAAQDGVSQPGPSQSSFSNHKASWSSTSPFTPSQSDRQQSPVHTFQQATSQHGVTQGDNGIPDDLPQDVGAEGSGADLNRQQLQQVHLTPVNYHEIGAQLHASQPRVPKKGRYSSAEERYIDTMMSAGVCKEKVAEALGWTPQGALYTKWKRMRKRVR